MLYLTTQSIKTKIHLRPVPYYYVARVSSFSAIIYPRTLYIYSIERRNRSLTPKHEILANIIAPIQTVIAGPLPSTANDTLCHMETPTRRLCHQQFNFSANNPPRKLRRVVFQFMFLLGHIFLLL